jgi:hypothetical protein
MGSNSIYKKISMNKVVSSYVIFIIVLITSFSKAQTYSQNREKFLKELMNGLSDIKTSDPRDFAKNELKNMLIETSDFPDDYFKRMVETCNLLETKKLHTYPEIYNYVYSMYSIIEKKQSSASYKAWHTAVDQLLLSKNLNKFKDFIELSSDFFSKGIISDAPNHVWLFKGGKFSFDVTDKPVIKFENGKLSCLAKNTNNETKKDKPFHDSIVVYGTSGIYDPVFKKFEGNGGVITWEKVGMDKATNFATLKHFAISLKMANLDCDTVLLVTPYFTKPILGKLNDKAFVVTREIDRTFPAFISFDKRLFIKNIKENVDYNGGYSQRGNSFEGIGSVKEPAIITIYEKGKAFIKMSAQIISVNPKKIISPNSHVAIYIGQNDSISHPGLDIVYNLEKHAIDFTRGKNGASSAPFSSSYHNLDFYVPKINWVKGKDTLNLEFEQGLSQEQRIARFESKTLFDARLYERLQAMEKVHPLIGIANFCNEKGSTSLTEGDLASAMNKTIEQAKSMILELNSLGFINYDLDTRVVTVNPKTFNFVQARVDQIDYDNLMFVSDLRPKKIEGKTQEEIDIDENLTRLDQLYKKQSDERRKIPYFGVINLNSLDMKLEAVDQVALSETQQIAVFPRNANVTIQKDRDFIFSGWMNSGKMEINALEAKFVYADNKVKLLKTESSLFRVSPLKKEDGDRPIATGSVITGITGELFVDAPSNRSGKSKTVTDFPKISVFNNVKVYYAQKTLHKGAYDSARFYFDVYPFAMDSLDNFKEKAFRLKGELYSAGIFPVIKQELKIMPDYSFGFSQEAPKGGYDFYGTGAKYDNKIVLSNNGLQGSGKIDFVQSSSVSRAFTFLPDSTVGYAVFDNKPIETGVQFPDVVSQKAYICYIPRGNKLKAYSTDVPLAFFNNEAKLNGMALVTPNGMTGTGIMNFDVANLGSSLFKFTRWDMNADTSFFNLLNKEAVNEDRDQKYSLTTENIKSHISFKDRIGNFVSNAGATIVSFPVNMYDCTMDKFDWLIDKDKIDLSTNDKNLVASKNENLISNMFSTNPRQDSLQFRTSKAFFDLKVNDLLCTDTRYIDVADARIYPDSGRVVIRKKAKMDPLNNSKIVANRVTRFHTFLNTKTVIASRNSYTSRGDYPYYDADSNLTIIKLDNIIVDSALHTVAIGKINEADTFKLSSKFEYYGAVKINSSTPLLSFNGSTRIKHNCTKFTRSWMAFNSEINPKNIQIPVGEKMKTLSNTLVSAGILWRDSPSSDSVRMYPTFLSPLKSSKDPVVITASGVLQYKPDANEFQIGSKEKLKNAEVKGNFIALNTKQCVLSGSGIINLGMDFGSVKVSAVGNIKYDTETGVTKLDITAKFNMPIEKSILPIAVSKINIEESLSSIDSANCNLFQAVREWSDEKTANRLITAYREKGQYNKVPSEFEDGIVITGLKLASFENKQVQEKGLLTTSDLATIVNMNNNIVMKQVPIKAFLGQMYSENEIGDKFGLYLNAAVGMDYYFEYAMTKNEGDMKVFSEDEDFANAINELKSDKRKAKNFIYEFTDNRVYISKFLRLFSKN